MSPNSWSPIYLFFLSYSIQSVFWYFFLSHCLFLSDKEQSTAEKESSEKEKKESPEKENPDNESFSNETKTEQSEKSLNTKPEEEQEIGDEEQQDGDDADSNQPARNIDAVEILFDLEAAELLPVVIKYV